MLVYWYRYRPGQEAFSEEHASGSRRSRTLGRVVFFLGTLWLLAFVEELLWDRGVWHERSWLFGSAWHQSERLQSVLVPLLAVPQITHYILDGFIWKRRSNPRFRETVESTPT